MIGSGYGSEPAVVRKPDAVQSMTPRAVILLEQRLALAIGNVFACIEDCVWPVSRLPENLAKHERLLIASVRYAVQIARLRQEWRRDS